MNDLGEKARPKVEAGKVGFFLVSIEDAGQRIDNFLLRLAKGVPKSHVYRVIRDGEVRVNRKRVDVTYRLQEGDRLRLPPMRISTNFVAPVKAQEFPVVFEDDYLLVIDKPAGVAVHGGSGVSSGVIEQLRAARPQARFLELVHRLDRDTSGLLMIGKRRSALTGLHAALRDGTVDKRYLALVNGRWPNARQHVKEPLVKFLLADGQRRVRVDPAGIAAHTVFSLKEKFAGFSLLEAHLLTGRTHQIRVHLSHCGYPIVGDDKYGDDVLNKSVSKGSQANVFKRMFLHSWHLTVTHPVTSEVLALEAPLPAECEAFLESLRCA